MHKALLDTNILIDAFAQRRPFCASAESLLRFAAIERYTACVSGSSVTDIYYIISRQAGHEKGLAAVRMLLKVFKIVAVGEEVCAAAVRLNWKDYEDAVLMACGIIEQVDFIVTRDKELLDAAKTVALPFLFLSPQDFAARLDGE